MNPTASIALFLAGMIPVDATTLDGLSYTGELTYLDSRVAKLAIDGESKSLPVDNLHGLRIGTLKDAGQTTQVLQLRDGSTISFEQFETTARSARVITPLLGQLEFARGAINHVRFARLDSKIESAWEELAGRESRDDLVILRKGDALDHVAGVISTVDDESVQLLLEGSAIPVPRSRVFAIVFAGSEPAGPEPVGHIELQGGDQLTVTSILLHEDGFHVDLAAGGTVLLAAADILYVDYSLGKVAYLDGMKPAEIDYPTDHPLFLMDVWRYRQGENSLGEPLRIGRETFNHGLWIHSGTRLTYRLNRSYRHLRATCGIAEGIGEACQPEIGLMIRGDGRELLDISLARGDEPRDLEIDVSEVRELEIEVTSTNPDGVCEHLGLGDARVIK